MEQFIGCDAHNEIQRRRPESHALSPLDSLQCRFAGVVSYGLKRARKGDGRPSLPPLPRALNTKPQLLRVYSISA